MEVWVLRSNKDKKIIFQETTSHRAFIASYKNLKKLEKKRTHMSALSAVKKLKTFQKLTIMFVVFVVSSLKLFLGYRKADIGVLFGAFLAS